MKRIYLIRLVVPKRPGFQSQKYGMPTNWQRLFLLFISFHCH